MGTATPSQEFPIEKRVATLEQQMADILRSHLDRGFVMKPTQEGILIAPAAGSKLTLEESFAAMALDKADLKSASEWAETGLADGLEEDKSRHAPGRGRRIR